MCAEQSQGALQSVKTQAAVQLSHARAGVPALWSQVDVRCTRSLSAAAAQSVALKDDILARTGQEAARAGQATSGALDAVSASARQRVRQAATDSQALVREITGQGPEKTLARGFAVVRSRDGTSLTRAAQATGTGTGAGTGTGDGAGAIKTGVEIEIEFQDGRVAAAVHPPY